ncbi:EF-hand domain-containing protein [archaeon]|nr:MAG: EF-hand domain-containing protein [archaeon]
MKLLIYFIVCLTIVLEPNHSYNIASVLRGNEPVKATDPLYMNQVKHMASQAKKVLQHLNTTPKAPKSQSEIIRASAQLAEERLQKLRQSGIDISKYYQQYDVERNGRISYKDFSDTLLSLSTGISREDAIMLAASLDKNKAGSVDYKNIFS